MFTYDPLHKDKYERYNFSNQCGLPNFTLLCF